MEKPIILTEHFRDILSRLEKEHLHAFITGRAGTGKSTLLQLFRNTTKKKVVVLAPTGIAALNVEGQTLHSFFRFPPRPIGKKDIKKVRYGQMYRKIDTIIIDEISMVRADIIDNIDYFMRINGRDSTKPFGGCQMIFFGDLYQLPPVLKREEEPIFRQKYETPYFFSSNIYQSDEIYMETFELQEVFRQKDGGFIRLLDAIRSAQIDFDELEEINSRYNADFEDNELYVTLAGRNATVNDINKDRLESLDASPYTYAASVNGNFRESAFPAPLLLRLKEGAQVMFVRNDVKHRYVNGTLGRVVHLDPDSIRVAIPKDDESEKVIEVKRAEWEMLQYKLTAQGELGADPVGTFKQYPLKLAWAITIHKSQGKTFEHVAIDMGKGAFEHGQTYVALSRCTTLEGIVLKSPLKPRDIMVDLRVVEFMEMR